MSHPLLKKLGILLLSLLALWLGSRYLLPIALPFLLAALLALISEPLVRVLKSRLRLPDWAASGVGVTVTLLTATLILAALLAFLLQQAGKLANVLPDLEETALQGMDSLELFLLDMADRTPKGIRPILTHSVEDLFSDGNALVDRVSSGVIRLASGVVTQLPDSMLGIGTWLIACYLISNRLSRIRQWLRTALPPQWTSSWKPALLRLRHSLGGWLLAQLKLAGVTFLLLCAGFLLLRISYAPLWAALISLLDALPVLGTGIFLVPWSLVCLLQGQPLLAAGLLGLYGGASALRSILEPKFIGKQLGLDPLVTLAAMYTGYRLWGLLGMILAPLLSVAVTQLFAARQKPEP